MFQEIKLRQPVSKGGHEKDRDVSLSRSRSGGKLDGGRLVRQGLTTNLQKIRLAVMRDPTACVAHSPHL